MEKPVPNSHADGYLKILLFTMKIFWKLLGFMIVCLPENQKSTTSYDRRMELSKLDSSLVDPHQPK